MATNEKPLVRVIGTGGSISFIGNSRIDYIDYTYSDRHFSIEELLARVPELQQFARVESEQFTNVGSTEVGPPEWLKLARRINHIYQEKQDVAGVAITHGTATLEETAYFLNLTVKDERPVVVTGAMRPPTAISTDTDINILDCVRVAASPEARNKGVLTVLNNEIEAAREVTKTSSYRVDTFNSRDLGHLGYCDSDLNVVFYRTPTRRHTHQTEFDVEAMDVLPRVEIVQAYGGADGLLVKALAGSDVSGIVVGGMGSGSVPRAFTAALQEAQDHGIVVMMTTQAGSGRIVSTRRFRELGFLVADNLAAKKARILLMLGLAVTNKLDRIQQMVYDY